MGNICPSGGEDPDIQIQKPLAQPPRAIQLGCDSYFGYRYKFTKENLNKWAYHVSVKDEEKTFFNGYVMPR